MEDQDFPYEIQAKLDNLTKQRARTIELTETYKHVQEAIELFSDALPGLMCLLSVSEYDKGWVYIQANNVVNLKSVVPLIRFLRKKGHKVEAPFRDYPEQNFRDYFLQDIQLRIHLAVSGDDKKACKYVQTGTKTVPVYELRCVGDDAPEMKPEESSTDQPPF